VLSKDAEARRFLHRSPAENGIPSGVVVVDRRLPPAG
jgi:hypothetical protein